MKSLQAFIRSLVFRGCSPSFTASPPLPPLFLPLSASGVLGILGFVCSPSLSSQLSRSSPRTLLTSLLLCFVMNPFFLSFFLFLPSALLSPSHFHPLVSCAGFFFFSLNIPVVVRNNKKSSLAAFLYRKLQARTIFCLCGVMQRQSLALGFKRNNLHYRPTC